MTVEYGSSIDLYVENILPEGNPELFTWTVEPADAASIEGNMLTPLCNADMQLTVTAVSWDGVSRSQTVNVLRAKEPVSGISFEPVPQLWYGAEHQLIVHVYAGGSEVFDELVAFDSDSSYITVDANGLVTCSDVGRDYTATVTATAENGISASVIISVCAPLADFTLEDDLKMQTGNSHQISILSYIGNSYGWTYRADDSGVVSVDENGWVTALKPGDAVVSVRTWSGLEKTINVHVHNVVTVGAVPPTCTEPGLTGDSYCSTCGEVLAVQEEAPATGHLISFEQNVYETTAGEEAIQVSAAFTCGHEAVLNFAFPETLEVIEITEYAIIVACNKPGAAMITVETDDAAGGAASCALIIHAPERLVLPQMLTCIEEESFMDLSIREVVLSENIASIGERAFANCGDLAIINLPDGVQIAEDAFFGCDQLAIICTEGSSAQEYAQSHGIPYVVR